MSRTASRRLLAQSPHSFLSDLTLVHRPSSRCRRPFSTTPHRKAEGDSTKPVPFPSLLRSKKPTAPPTSPSLNSKAAVSDLGDLASIFKSMTSANQLDRRSSRNTPLDTDFASDGAENLVTRAGEHVNVAWQLHIYATRHNVHITLVRPPNWYHPQTGKRYPEKGDNRTVAMSLAAGNLGFRKSGRKHYDSAFQLASYVMSRMQESGMNAWIKELEVFLRGFGAGREAVTKALLGSEGRYLRGKVVKVSDATRLKFGGTRSKKPRRLG